MEDIKYEISYTRVGVNKIFGMLLILSSIQICPSWEINFSLGVFRNFLGFFSHLVWQSKDPGCNCDFELLKLSWIDLNWSRSLLQSDRTQKKPQREGETIFKHCYSNQECIWEFKEDRWPILTFHPQTLTLHQNWKRQTWQSILLFLPGFLLSPTSMATSSPTDMRMATWRYQAPRHFFELHQTFINTADFFFLLQTNIPFVIV